MATPDNELEDLIKATVGNTVICWLNQLQRHLEQTSGFDAAQLHRLFVDCISYDADHWQSDEDI